MASLEVWSVPELAPDQRCCRKFPLKDSCPVIDIIRKDNFGASIVSVALWLLQMVYLNARYVSRVLRGDFRRLHIRRRMYCNATVLAGSITVIELYSATLKLRNGSADWHCSAVFEWVLSMLRNNDSPNGLRFEILRTSLGKASNRRNSI